MPIKKFTNSLLNMLLHNFKATCMAALPLFFVAREQRNEPAGALRVSASGSAAACTGCNIKLQQIMMYMLLHILGFFETLPPELPPPTSPPPEPPSKSAPPPEPPPPELLNALQRDGRE